MGFDVIYLPPIHPIGEVNRKGANNTLTPTPDDVGSPWAIGSRVGGHDAIHPDLGTHRGLRRVRRRGRAARARGGPRLRAPGGARPPVGDRAPGVVHDPRRRHHRLRREPAEEVPGHLPDQLRQRPRGDLRRGRAARALLDVPRRADLPRRQPAHQAAGVLGVAARPHPGDRPRRPLPGRGVHAAAADAGPRRDRLPPELHALHLAHRPVGARAVPPRDVARDQPPDAAELLRQHPRHPARVPAVRRPAGVQDPRGDRRHGLAELGRVRRLRALRARRPQAGQRGVPRLREVPDPGPRLGPRRPHRADAGAVPRQPEPDPPPAPGPPAAAQRARAQQRRRRRAGVQQVAGD